MTKILFYILLGASIVSCGQQTSTVTTENISQAGLSKKLNIPGTRIFISPPKNFQLSKSIVGLEYNTSIIQFYDLIGGDYDNSASTFNRTDFEKRGMKVLDFKEFKIDSYPAKFLHAKKDNNSDMIAIVFGDSSFSVMTMAVFSNKDKELAKEIEQSLTSLSYNKQYKVDPLVSTFYRTSENESKFKFAKSSANFFIYSYGGIVKDSYENESMVTITTFPSNKDLNPELIAKSMLNGLEQNGFVKTSVKNISKDSINGYPAYEAEIDGLMKNKKTLFYLLVLAHNDKAIGFYGISYSNYITDLRNFKLLSNSLEFK